MKYRIAIWAGVGLLVAAGWALYALATKPPALSLSDPLLPLVRLTCPIAILASSYPISLYSALLANAATYALAGLMVDSAATIASRKIITPVLNSSVCFHRALLS